MQNERATDPANRPTDFPFTEGVAAARFAMALHSGGSSVDHLDFFLGSASSAKQDARTARTWRLPLTAVTRSTHATRLVAGDYDADEIAPHRTAYLWLETIVVLSDGRGSVEPLLHAECIAEIGANMVRLTTDAVRITFTRRVGSCWRCKIEFIATRGNDDDFT